MNSISRRSALSIAAGIGATALVFPEAASACRGPPKRNYKSYQKSIDGLFSAWMDRDRNRFRSFGEHELLEGDYSTVESLMATFDAHELSEGSRLGETMFIGTTAIVQVLSFKKFSCSGFTDYQLWKVNFFPGIYDSNVVQELSLVEDGAAAMDFWEKAKG